MKRADFEHVIAVAAQITGETEFVVVGSQAILAVEAPIPNAMLRSIEADIYPLNAPWKATEIDAEIGDNSRFHSLHGYYAHGVGPEPRKLQLVGSDGWSPSRSLHGLPPPNMQPRSASRSTTSFSRNASEVISVIGTSLPRH